MHDITLLSELLPRTAARTPDAVAVESSTGSPALTESLGSQIQCFRIQIRPQEPPAQTERRVSTHAYSLPQPAYPRIATPLHSWIGQ
jgi:hypothetical protein